MQSEETPGKAQATQRPQDGGRYDGAEYELPVSLSGLAYKASYGPSDMQNTDLDEIGLPGEYPYTRGIEDVPRRLLPWIMRIAFGHGSTEDVRNRWDFLKSIGMAHRVGQEPEGSYPRFSILLDLPSQQGLDPDDPEAEGRVGTCGSSWSSLGDFARAFDGIPLDKLEVHFHAFEAELIMIAMYMVYAERRGYSWEQLMISTPNVPYRQYWWDTVSFPPDHAKKLVAEQIHNNLRRVPATRNHSNITGYNLQEAGAHAVQEVAFSLSAAIDVMRECIKAGLDPDEVAPKMYHHPHANLAFLEEIAKFRALRRMWAKVFKEKFGCRKPESLKIRTFPQTAGSYLPAQEPLNNIVRTTLMTLAGVLGGADGIWTTCYDEALNTPTDESQKLAVRIQQIIYHETDIANVADALGGSYCIESLTNEIEEKATRLLDEIEEQGGAFECWKNGWFLSELVRGFNKRQDSIDSGERVIVGANRYVTDVSRERTLEISPDVEKNAVKLVTEHRAGRNNEACKAALRELKEGTRVWAEEWPHSCGSLMEAIVEAVRAEATLGEIHSVLQEVMGHGYA